MIHLYTWGSPERALPPVCPVPLPESWAPLPALHVSCLLPAPACCRGAGTAHPVLTAPWVSAPLPCLADSLARTTAVAGPKVPRACPSCVFAPRLRWDNTKMAKKGFNKKMGERAVIRRGAQVRSVLTGGVYTQPACSCSFSPSPSVTPPPFPSSKCSWSVMCFPRPPGISQILLFILVSPLTVEVQVGPLWKLSLWLLGGPSMQDLGILAFGIVAITRHQPALCLSLFIGSPFTYYTHCFYKVLG